MDLLRACEAVEWGGTNEDGEAICPECAWPMHRGKHDADCKLRQAIARARGEE
jgi:hypothetical protein